MLVTEEWRESDAFAAATGEPLRGDADGGDVGLFPTAPKFVGDTAGEAGSGGGSAKDGIGSGGEDERSSEKWGLGNGGESERSGGGSLKLGRGG